MNKKGLSLNSVIKYVYITVVVLLVVLIFLVYSLVSANRQMATDTKSYSTAMGYISQIREASYYLTEESRKYVVTGNMDHMDNYFEEVNVTQRRENAHDELSKYNLSEDFDQYYEEALEASAELEVIEMRALHIAAYANGVEDSDLPDEVLTYELAENELGLDKNSLKRVAVALLYSDEYMEKQNIMLSSLEMYNEATEEAITAELDKSTDDHNFFINLIVAFVAVMYLIVLAIIILMSELVFKPLKQYLGFISREVEIPPSGSSELREFALAYNEALSKHGDGQKAKQMEQNLDAETGAYNNYAFMEKLIGLSRSATRATLAVVEIDNFDKDSRSHNKELCRAIMVELYQNLAEVFGADSVFKISENQFTIVIPDQGEEFFELFKTNIHRVNKMLVAGFNTENITISAGVAYTDEAGYENMLFNHATVALYKTRDLGGADASYYVPEKNNF